MFDILDFDANFQAYLAKWMEMNAEKFANVDQMEDAIPTVYMRWLNSPAAFLDGDTPAAYFSKYDSAPELIKWMRLYEDENVPVPDQLMERIVQLGSDSVHPLMYTAKNAKYSNAVRVTALNLLKEIETRGEPAELCMEIIDARTEQDELADVAAELLLSYAGAVKDKLIERLESASEAARETYLDILCNFPGDERIYAYVLEEFLAGGKYALYASFLGKLGDDRAIEPLTRALDIEELNYLDYIEIRNAIEALGGECNHEREFAGDPYYDSLGGTN